MTIVWTEVLADLLQGGHPGHGEVTVLQTHPGSFLHGCEDHLGRDGTLALAQRDGLESGPAHALVVGKLQQAWSGRQTLPSGEWPAMGNIYRADYGESLIQPLNRLIVLTVMRP